MINIAVLGYGTVGSGVVEVLNVNQASIAKRAGDTINVKYVLDLRDFPGDPIQEKVVHDYSIILNDPEVKVVVEVMGGVEPACTFVRQALVAGKSVATSNKELVAKHGANLLQLAKANDANFFFEASVGGGIPVIRPLNSSVTADEILSITGILNGTTNYMLTKMDREGADYATVLKQAQDNGYAERHPEADVEGYDACRKIAILTSLAYGQQVDYEDIYTEGITAITDIDFKYAKAMGKSLKLLGRSVKKDGQVFAMVAPFMIGAENPLSNVNDVFNAILINGNMLGDIMFYGKGAGKLPTASAVVSDVIEAVKHLGDNVETIWNPDKMELADHGEYESSFLVRVSGDYAKRKEELEDLFGEICLYEVNPGEFGFATQKMSVKALSQKTDGLNGFISRLFIA